MKYLLSQEVVDEPSSTIEELTRTDLVPASGYTDRWLGLAIALITAVMCFGFIGRTWGPAPTASAPTALSASTEPLAASSPRLTIPVATSPASTFVVLSPAASIWRSVATEASGGKVALTVDGVAPSSIGQVAVSVRMQTGRFLARAHAPVAVDDERPGSNGGARTGTGSFHVRIVVAGPIPRGGWQLEVSWRDESNGSSGSASQLVTTIGH
jgi:hypothetical protein